MSKVQPYQEQITAQGVSHSQSTPELAGVGVGEAGIRLGNALGQVGREYQARKTAVEEDQAKLWAATATAETEVQLGQRMTQRVDSLDPTSKDYGAQIAGLTDAANSDFQDSTQQLMDEAPNNQARQLIAMHAATARVRFMGQAMNTQSQLNANFSVQIAQNGMKANSQVLASNPDNDTFQNILGQTTSTINALSIDPVLKSKLIENSRQNFAKVQVTSVSSKNPQQFLATIASDGGSTTPATANVPAQPEMLAYANQQIAAGKSPDDAMVAMKAKFHENNPQFSFGMSPDGKSFVDNGQADSGSPQIKPLTDQQILAAKVPLDGWSELDPGDRISAVRAAEATLGKSLASDRGAVASKLQDANAAALTGQPYPGEGSPELGQDNLIRLFGVDKGNRAYQQLQYNQRVGKAVSQMATMPDAQMTATLNALKPTPGDGFAVDQPKYNAVVAAAQHIVAERQKFPQQYAIDYGIGGAKPLDFSSPETLMTGLRQRAQVSDIMHNDYGTKYELFTKGDVSKLSGALDAMAGPDRINYLMGVRAGLPDDGKFSLAMNELATNKPALAYAAKFAVDAPDKMAKQVAEDIATGDILRNGRILASNAKPGEVMPMPSGSKQVRLDEHQFQQAFETVLPPTAFQNPDPQQGAIAQRTLYNATADYYVAQQYRQGKPLDGIPDPQDVQEAVNAVTGGVWKSGAWGSGPSQGAALLVPLRVPMEQFQAQWFPRATKAFLDAGFTQEQVDTNLDKFRPYNIDDGRYGFMNGTRVMRSPKTGKPIVVDYSQELPVSNAVTADAHGNSPMRAPTAWGR